MHTLKRRIDNRVAWTVIIAVICIAMSWPAFAGTMYNWQAQDGSETFTDDPKRIPARYRNDADRRPMGHLKDYSRYTPSQVSSSEAYAERLVRRLEHLRKQGARPGIEVTGADGLRLGIRVEGDDFVSMPLAGYGDEPTVVESVRLKRDPGHITTRHATAIRQGDRLLAISKAERNDSAPREWLADPVPDPQD